MRFSLKLKTVAASAVAAVALMTVGASAASAVPATWVSGGQAKLSGTLTVSQGIGGLSTTCPMNPNHIYAAGNQVGPPVQASFSGAVNDPGGRHYCANWNALTLRFGPTIYTGAKTLANKSGTAFSLAVVPGGGYAWNPFDPGSPTGYAEAAYSVPFVNGTATVPSKLAYSNTAIGGGLYATGNVNVTKLDGSLLKLQ